MLATLPHSQAALDFLRAHGARGLTSDTRRLRAGDAFVAWPGLAVDPRRYVSAALAAGASACLVDADGAEAYAFDDARIAALPGLKAATGEIAHRFVGEPSEHLDVIAVTGTNGKTSTAWWTAQALTAIGQPCGLIGTLGQEIGRELQVVVGGHQHRCLHLVGDAAAGGRGGRQLAELVGAGRQAH